MTGRAGTEEAQERSGNRFIEVLPPLLVSLVLLLHCLWHGIRAPYWVDEVFTYLFVADPSLPHMLAANRDNINTVPPLYFILWWFWGKAFGIHWLTLRLGSSLAFAAGVWLTWSLLRRRFAYIASAIALFLCLPTGQVLGQNHDARFYGLYFFLSVLAIWQYDVLQHRREAGIVRRADYLGALLCHTALVFTHTIGIFVSGSIVLTDALYRQRRGKPIDRRLIFAIGLSLALFALLWGPTLVSQTRAFVGTGLFDRPTVGNAAYSFFILSPMILVAAITAAILLVARSNLRAATERESADPLPLLAGILVTVPWAVLQILALFGNTNFPARYLVFGQAAWAILFAMLLHRAVRVSGGEKPTPLRAVLFVFPTVPPRHRRAAQLTGTLAALWTVTSGLAVAFGGLMTAAMLLQGYRIIVPASAPYAMSRIEVELKAANVPADMPVILTNIAQYVGQSFYMPRPTRYYYVLDREYISGSGPDDYPHRSMDDTLMEAIKRQYGDPNVRTWEEFRQSFPRFAVYDARPTTDTRWVEYRLTTRSDYRTTPLPAPEGSLGKVVLLLAERNDGP
jgi:hypothetical protein